MKKQVVSALIIISLLSAGCWSQVELSDLALVVGTAIDRQDGADSLLYITEQIANPIALVPGGGGGGGGQGGPKAFWTITGEGKTIQDAVNEMSHRVPKRIFSGHNRLAIIGEKAAKDGIIPIMDRYFRNREDRKSLFLCVSKGDAKKVLEVEMPTFRASGLAITNIFEVEDGRHSIIAVRVSDMADMLSSGSIAPVLPIVRIVPQTSVSAEDKKAPSGPSDTIRVGDLAVFSHKGVLIGYLKEDEAFGYMWVRDRVRQRGMEVQSPGEGPGSAVTAEVLSSSSSIKSRIGEDGIPEITVTVDCVFDMQEHFGLSSATSQPAYYKNLEHEVEREIRHEIMTAFNKSKSMNADFLQIGETIRRQHHQEWHYSLEEHWGDILPQVKLTAISNARFRNRGIGVVTPGSEEED